MTIDQNELENLESFLDGTLSEDDAKRLEQRLEGDPVFLAEAQSYIQLIRNLEQADPDRKKVQILVQSINEVKTSGIRQLKFYLKIAAGLMIITVSSIWLFKANLAPRKEEAQVNFEINIISTNERDDSISIAEKEYLNGHYSKAAGTFNSEYQTQKNNMLLRFNYAVACFKANDFVKAQIGFLDVARSNDNLKEDAQFYLALSYFQNGQMQESKRILDSTIINQDHPKVEDAIILLDKIKNNTPKRDSF